MDRSLKERSSVLYLLLVVLVLAALVFFNQTTTSTHPVGISLSNFQLIGIQSVNSSGSTLEVQFEIMNSLPLGVNLRDASYFLYADGTYIGRGAVVQSFKIPADGSVSAVSDFLVPLDGSIRGTWDYFIDSGHVSWRAIGNATVTESFTGSLEVSFNCLSSPDYSSISCSYAVS